MTEYTGDKDGNVTSKGKGKKPLPTRYMDGDIPLTIPSIAKKVKSAFLKKTKPKIKPKPKPPKPIKPKPKPKPVRKAKGGLVSRGTKFKGIF